MFDAHFTQQVAAQGVICARTHIRKWQTQDGGPLQSSPRTPTHTSGELHPKTEVVHMTQVST